MVRCPKCKKPTCHLLHSFSQTCLPWVVLAAKAMDELSAHSLLEAIPASCKQVADGGRMGITGLPQTAPKDDAIWDSNQATPTGCCLRDVMLWCALQAHALQHVT